MALVTLAQVKAYMGLTTTTYDTELNRYISQALGVVELHAGPVLESRSFTERAVSRGHQLILDRYPITAVTSVSEFSDGVVTAYSGAAAEYAIVDADAGTIRSPFADGTIVQVVYTAGLTSMPAEAEDAALVFISYKYRRNHGGSESYMPAGPDGSVSPPMGTAALAQQVRFALGSYVDGGSIA